MTTYCERLSQQRLERAELLTPVGTKAAHQLMREAGVHDHHGDILADGTRVLVTPIVVGIREH